MATNDLISDWTLDEDGDLVLTPEANHRLHLGGTVLDPHDEEEMLAPPAPGEIEIVIGDDSLIPELETDAPEGMFA